jgi:hypothetical protein
MFCFEYLLVGGVSCCMYLCLLLACAICSGFACVRCVFGMCVYVCVFMLCLLIIATVVFVCRILDNRVCVGLLVEELGFTSGRGISAVRSI